jgi:hypothetical protein
MLLCRCLRQQPQVVAWRCECPPLRVSPNKFEEQESKINKVRAAILLTPHVMGISRIFHGLVTAGAYAFEYAFYLPRRIGLCERRDAMARWDRLARIAQAQAQTGFQDCATVPRLKRFMIRRRARPGWIRSADTRLEKGFPPSRMPAMGHRRTTLPSGTAPCEPAPGFEQCRRPASASGHSVSAARRRAILNSSATLKLGCGVEMAAFRFIAGIFKSARNRSFQRPQLMLMPAPLQDFCTCDIFAM